VFLEYADNMLSAMALYGESVKRGEYLDKASRTAELAVEAFSGAVKSLKAAPQSDESALISKVALPSLVHRVLTLLSSGARCAG
jgi:hypothetical protein